MKNLIKKYLKDFNNGTKKMFKEFFNKKTIIKQIANMLTFTRLIIPFITLIVSILAIITGILPMFIACGVIAGVGSFTDFLDGKISRNTKTTSEYGKMLDQLSDKFFTGIIGLNLLFLNQNYIILLIGELIISSINMIFKLKYKDLNISSTKTGKVKQWPLSLALVLGYFSTLNNVYLAISNILIFTTFLFQLATANSYIKTNKKAVKILTQTQNQNIINETKEENNLDNVKTHDNVICNKVEHNISRKQQYQKLRDVLNLIIDSKTDNEISKKSTEKQKMIK